MMYYSGYPLNGWQMFVGMLTMTALSIALIWAVAWVVVSSMQHRDRNPPVPREPDALAILRRRYAAGELDDAEYERRRQILRGA